jgi:protein-disulfide isomerase
MSRQTQPVGPGDHVMGRSDARVTVVEYVDYECHYCARAHGVVSDVMEQVGNEARLVVRHFPLSQIHRHALIAAQAAETAESQGFFWPMHAMLFENQLALDPASLAIYADVLGLDVPLFTRELHSGAHLAKIQTDFKSGVRGGVNGTPTFFVNGERLDRGWDASTLLAAIRQPEPKPEEHARAR